MRSANVAELQAEADRLRGSRGKEGDSSPGKGGCGELIEIDLTELSSVDPGPPAFIVPGWLPEGEVTLLAADGGTGKSLLMLELAVCCAVGIKWHGLDVAQREVVFVSFEDKRETLHWRLRRICAAHGLRVADLVGRLTLLDGTQAVEPWYGRGEGGATGATGAFAAAAERIGVDRLVIVDGVADVFAGNENARSEVKAFVRMVRRLAGPRGAVLLIAHVDKAAAKEPQDALGFSGSTGWNNSVRCRWYMFRDREDGAETGSVRIEVRKSNLGPGGQSLVLAYDPARHVFVDPAAVPAATGACLLGRVIDSDAVLAVVTEAWRVNNPIPVATAGSRTGYAVAKTFAQYPRSSRGLMSKTRFDAAVNELRNAGAIEVAALPRANRHPQEVLRPAGEGALQSADAASQSGDAA